MTEEDHGPSAGPQRTDEQQPTEEELRAAFEEQLKRITVQDVLLQTVVTLVNLSGRRLTGEEKDLEQARLGIDAVRALLPLCPEDQIRPVRDALAQLQMVYAHEARATGAPAPEARQAATSPSEAKGDPSDAERAKARSKIWTPPGS